MISGVHRFHTCSNFRDIVNARSISMRLMRVRCVFLISVSLILIWLLHYAMYMTAEGGAMTFLAHGIAATSLSSSYTGHN
ncbi:hypothetical protein TNCT_599851 [Trichonephila clavata]|uniref:Uncharacterized protein n=1 Tax=Trichonephila clavata TaxID=2740835 RepID=A0A8X6GBU8_TRICU|nr:hypothetical protein TNCT_599851 [Trichonephila clavata]